MPLCGICGTPFLNAPSLPIFVPSGPADAESHRNLHRHGAAIPGSLILNLFSIRPVPCVLTSILLVLYVSGLTRPAPYDFSLVRFCLGGPLLAVSRCEWQWFFVHRRMLHVTRTVSSRFVSLAFSRKRIELGPLHQLARKRTSVSTGSRVGVERTFARYADTTTIVKNCVPD